MMSGIWKRVRDLFRDAADSTPANPVHHATIERTKEEMEGYRQWQNSLVMRRLMDWLSAQFAIYQVTPSAIDEAIDFLDTPSSKGFVVHFYQTNYQPREVTFFFDFLKDRMREHDYKLQLSDTRTYNRPDWVETVERHYLKPRPQFGQGEKQEQRFGNVTIEMVLRNNEVYQLKLQATTYQDRQYAEAERFTNLMQLLLT